MTRLMPQPWKHPELGTYYYRKVVPAKLRRAVGQTEIRISLDTKSAAEAKLKYPDAAAQADAILAKANGGTRILEGCPAVVPVSRPRPMLLPCCRRRGRGQLFYNFFFGAERNYYRDQDLHQAGQAGVKEFDQEKRTAYFREVVDRANRMNYPCPRLTP